MSALLPGLGHRWIKITCQTIIAPTPGEMLDKTRHKLAFEYRMSRYALKLHPRFAQKLAAIFLTVVFLFCVARAGAAGGGVEKSMHDFSSASWVKLKKATWQDTENGVCSICHQAHNIGPPIVPLWAHETSTGPFTAYTPVRA